MTLRNILLVFLFSLVLGGCSDYQRLLKSHDYDKWYPAALAYYEKEDYVRASSLFSELINIYRGSDRLEDVNYKYANCLFFMGDYHMAAHYYAEFVRNFPASEHAEECQYLIGYSYYNLSAKPRLDQAETNKAIQEFQLFINLYPNSGRVDEVTHLMDEMRDKLVYKSYLNAKLYYNLGDYQGNNYKSAVIASENSLREFPDTKYREELSFLILESKYIQAQKSVIEKQEERARDAVDEYYNFSNEYPESKYKDKADRILNSAQSMIHSEVNEDN